MRDYMLFRISEFNIFDSDFDTQLLPPCSPTLPILEHFILKNESKNDDACCSNEWRTDVDVDFPLDLTKNTHELAWDSSNYFRSETSSITTKLNLEPCRSSRPWSTGKVRKSDPWWTGRTRDASSFRPERPGLRQLPDEVRRKNKILQNNSMNSILQTCSIM